MRILTTTARTTTARTAAATVLLAIATIPAAAATASASPAPDPQRQRINSLTAATPCFMGRSDWNYDLVGPPPTCTY